MITVQERIARANAYLAQKNGIDPNNASYKRAKQDIAYAFEHGIDVADVPQHRRKTEVRDTFILRIPTLSEVEKGLGRELRNTSSLPKGHVRPVVNPFTTERWSSAQALADHTNTSVEIVRSRILHKRPIAGNYYEYEK